MFLEISYNSLENICARVSFLTKRLWHKSFPVNFAKFLRTSFYIEHLCWLLLVLLTEIVKESSHKRVFLFSVLSTKAVALRCSMKNVLLEISQYLQENTCARVSFLIKLQASSNTFGCCFSIVKTEPIEEALIEDKMF